MAHALKNAFTRRQLLTGAAATAVVLIPATVHHASSRSLAQDASPQASPAASPQASPAGNEVQIHFTQELTFDPDSITVPVGTTVIWNNDSAGLHTVTCDPSKVRAPEAASMISFPDGTEPWASELLYPDDVFTHTFTTAGTYDYICVPHIAVGMRGTIIIE